MEVSHPPPLVAALRCLCKIYQSSREYVYKWDNRRVLGAQAIAQCSRNERRVGIRLNLEPTRLSHLLERVPSKWRMQKTLRVDRYRH